MSRGILRLALLLCLTAHIASAGRQLHQGACTCLEHRSAQLQPFVGQAIEGTTWLSIISTWMPCCSMRASPGCPLPPCAGFEVSVSTRTPLACAGEDAEEEVWEEGDLIEAQGEEASLLAAVAAKNETSKAPAADSDGKKVVQAKQTGEGQEEEQQKEDGQQGKQGGTAAGDTAKEGADDSKGPEPEESSDGDDGKREAEGAQAAAAPASCLQCLAPATSMHGPTSCLSKAYPVCVHRKASVGWSIPLD
jgi:hypothetical protein